jgi:uncharacterized membrane protein (UPF0182 family)
LLQKVLVSFGNTVKMDDTLGQALDQVFNGNSGTGPSPGGTTTPPSGGTTPPVTNSAALQQAIADAQAALAAATRRRSRPATSRRTALAQQRAGRRHRPSRCRGQGDIDHADAQADRVSQRVP